MITIRAEHSVILHGRYLAILLPILQFMINQQDGSDAFKEKNGDLWHLIQCAHENAQLAVREMVRRGSRESLSWETAEVFLKHVYLIFYVISVHFAAHQLFLVDASTAEGIVRAG
jgi:hypothetical protein